MRRKQRKTLATMNPAEARQHYEALVHSRVQHALLFTDAAMRAPRGAQRELTALADRKWERAQKFSKPCKFHEEAARERLAKYGMGAAAAYLAAHGWHARDAARILNVRFDSRPERPDGWDNPRSEWFDVYND